MIKRTAAVLVGSVLVVVGVAVSNRNAEAQGQSQVEVVHAVTHDVSPPLDKIPPLPPQAAVGGLIPFRPTRPVRTTPTNRQDSVLQSSATTTLSTNSGSDFLGVGNGLTGFTVQYIPPDTNGAAGGAQFVQWVNASFAAFKKSDGSVAYGPAAGNTLWSGMSGTAGQACAKNNSGDPIAEYDKQAGRWVMMQPVFKSPYYLCVAVSSGDDFVTSAWNRYAFPIPSGQFPDYPKLAVWGDAYYVTYNQFQGNSFAGAAACAMDRSNMLLGNAATMQCFNFNPAYGSVLPADLDGSTQPPSGSPEYVLNYDGNLASLDLWEFHADFGTPANSKLTGPNNIGVAAFSEACGGGTCVPQLGTSQQLDSLGDRLMYRVAYRNFGSYESMLISHSVNTGTSAGNTGVRWYELRETSPSTPPGSNWGLYQQGTYAPDSSYRWMGSIAQDKAGDITMGYSVSSSSMSPTIRYTGRVPGDASGTMESENDILSTLGISTGSQTSYTRWGDYSSMALDPVDDCTFWYTNEYQPKNGNAWSTRIASFSFSGCTGGTNTQDFSMSASPSSLTLTQGQTTGNTSTVSVTALNGFSSAVNFSLSGCPTSPANACTISPSSVTGSGSATLTVTTDTTTTPGTYTITVTGTSGALVHSTTVTVQVNAATTGSFTVTATPSSQSVVRPGSASYTVTVTPSGGFTGSVTLNVSGAPQRSSTSFSVNPVSISGASAASSTLTVKTNKRTATGSFTLTITATSGSLSSSTSVTVVVQ